MTVNQRQVTLPHLPSLLQNLAKNSVEYDFSGMVAVKVDFHFSLLAAGTSQQTGCHRKRIAGLSPSVHYFHGPGSIPILSLTASLNRCYNRDIFPWSAPRRGPAETES